MKVRAVAPLAVAAMLLLPAGNAASAAAVGRYAAAISSPRADPYYPAEGTTSVDVLHYGLDLTWDAATRRLSGTATIRFRATRAETRISLDFGDQLSFTSIRLDGRVPPGSGYGPNTLIVVTGPLQRDSLHTLVIRYHGSPGPVRAPSERSDLTYVGWTVQPDGEVWSIQEPFGAFTWYPVNDQPSDKAFYDITWHTKAAWRGVSNGDLLSDTVSHGERTMHWHLASPAASYLVTVAIGPYHAYHQRGPHGLPITYWVRNSDRDLLPELRHSPALIRWLEARLGPFPFDRIGAVVAPTTSAEETQTLVTIGRSVLTRRGGGLSDLLHEYSHQWYGDEVTPNNWKDLWMNESFAMYFQIRWEASHRGLNMASWRRVLNAADQVLRNVFGPPGEYIRNDFAELNVYYCGARMLDRLHAMLGSTLFWSVVRGWPASRRFGNADRGDWIRYLDRTTGRNLAHFVRHWLDARRSPVSPISTL